MSNESGMSNVLTKTYNSITQILLKLRSMKMRKIVRLQLLIGKHKSSVSIGGVCQAHQTRIKVPALIMELACTTRDTETFVGYN
jgi:hypothetical protein